MKNFIKTLIILLFIGLLPQQTFAVIESNPELLTLNDCIKKALTNSPEIKKSKIAYEMAKRKVKIAQSVYFPTISAGVGYNFSSKNGDGGGATNNGTSAITNAITSAGGGSSSSIGNAFSANAGLKEMIWNFGKSSADIKMSKFNKIVAKYNFDTTVLNTIFLVKVNYYSTLATKAALEVDKANLQINERNFQRVNAYFSEGIKSRIDLVNAEVYVTNAKVQLITKEKAVKNALSNLNNSMFTADMPYYNIEVPEQFKYIGDLTPKSLTDFSRPVDELLAAPKNVDDALYTASVEANDYASLYKMEKFPYTFEECIELAYKRRPDIIAYENTIKAMEEQKKSVQRQYYPELSATGTYNFNGANNNGNTSNANSFGVGVNLSSSVNIMSEKYQIENAQLQIDNAVAQLDLLKQTVFFDIQQAYINMMEYEEQIPLLEQKIQQTLENLELADGRYAVGLGDYIQLQDAKVNFNNAQHAFVEAVFGYSVAKARLEQKIAMEQEVTLKIED